MKTKTFMLDGIDLYITNVETKSEACVIAHTCGWGVMEENLIEIERLPERIKVYGLINKPRYEPGMSFAIDPMADY